MKNVHFEYAKVSRRFFWFLWILYAVVYMTKNCFTAAMASIVAEGAMTKSQTGLIVSAFYIVYAPLQVVGGIFADKYDPERLVKIGLLGSGLVNLIIFFNQNYYVILAAWVLNAVVQFALWPSIFKIISSQIYAADRESSAFYMSFASSVGLILAYLVAALISKWQYNFAISAVSLIALAVIFHIVCERVGGYMIPDVTFNKKQANQKSTGEASTMSLFLKSGFLFIIVIFFLRILICNSAQTLSPTILMESYEGVSPSIGNLLNMLVNISAILGTLLMKKLLYPKHIKDEVKGTTLMFALALVPTVVFVFTGKIGVSTAVVMLCIITCVLSAANLLSAYCNMQFSRFQKSGTAAGVMNAAASFGVMAQSYGFTRIADSFGWTTVAITWVAAVALAVLLGIIAMPLWKRFKKG